MVEIFLWIFGILFFGTLIIKHFFGFSIHKVDIDTLDQMKEKVDEQIEFNETKIYNKVIKQMEKHHSRINKNTELHKNLVGILEQFESEISKLNEEIEKLNKSK